jgi:hypothetical protein
MDEDDEVYSFDNHDAEYLEQQELIERERLNLSSTFKT